MSEKGNATSIVGRYLLLFFKNNNSLSPNRVICLWFVFLECVVSYNSIAQNNDSVLDTTILVPQSSVIMDLPLVDDREGTTNIASAQMATLRESPGIITVMNADEIKALGARDLFELLRFVPGFDFTHVFEGAVTLGTRGNSAGEGNILVLIDGHQLPENAYGTTYLGHHYLLDHIEKIEIIRGPGSAIYGGMAELAVINIVTKTPMQTEGYLSTTHAIASGGFTRNSFQGGLMHRFENDVKLSIHGYTHQGRRSTDSNQYLDGSIANYGDSSQILSQNLSVSVQHKALDISIMYDNYQHRVTEPAFGVQKNLWLYSRGIFFNASHSIKLSEKLTLSPQLSFKIQHPWDYFNGNEDYDPNNFDNTRGTVRLKADYVLNEKVSLMAGTQYYLDNTKYRNNADVFYNGKESVLLQNTAVFAEANIKTSLFNFVIGGRADIHSAVEAAFVPRFGITKAFDNWHFKALYSKAFKAPTFQNINWSETNISPEKVNVAELEMGYRINKALTVTANIFDIKIIEPILYLYFEDDDGNAIETYSNGTLSGSRGAELDLHFKQEKLSCSLQYSYYQAHYNETEAYQDENNDLNKLGLSRHKLTANIHFIPSKRWTIGSTFLFLSPKSGYVETLYDEELDEYLYPVYTTPPSLFVNTFITIKNIGQKLDLSIGVYNLLNSNSDIFPALNNEIPRIPEQTRELSIKALYKF